MTEVIRKPLISGHCAHSTRNPRTGETSHELCHRQGGGQRANPAREFQPCPCPCHYGEQFECGACGQPIREAPLWPYDEDGDMRYTHVDLIVNDAGEPVGGTGRALGEDCAPVSRNRSTVTNALPDPGEPARVYYEPVVEYADEDFSDLGDEEPDEDDEFAALLAELDEPI